MEGEPEVFQQDLVIQGEKVYEGLPVADFDVGLPDGALVWHQDGGNMTFDLAQDEALQGGQYFKMGGRVNWDWSLGYIDIPLDLTSVTTDAEGFFLNLGVLGGLNGELRPINTSTSCFLSLTPHSTTTLQQCGGHFCNGHGSVQASGPAGGLGGLAVCVRAVFGV